MLASLVMPVSKSMVALVTAVGGLPADDEGRGCHRVALRGTVILKLTLRHKPDFSSF